MALNSDLSRAASIRLLMLVADERSSGPLHGKIAHRTLFSLAALAEKAIKFSEQSVLGLVSSFERT